MVLTNALLSIGFSLVSNFASVVAVPADAVPKSIADLREFTVGDPHSPVDLYFTHRRGTMYAIRDGSVFMFETPGSYLNLQDSSRIPRLLGKATFTSNQVLELATRAVERLICTTNPIANIKPLVKGMGKFEGEGIPFYAVSWPKPYYEPGFGYFAGVEVDARTGRIVSLELHDPGFCNFALAQEISNKVYVADTPRTPFKTNFAGLKPPKKLFPCPTTNEVEQAIASWTWLCQKLRVEPGGETNLAAVNWDRTFLWTNRFLPGDPVECRVEFRNGANFCAVHGVALNHSAPDAYFVGDQGRFTREQMMAFRGKVNRHWEQLAKDLEELIVDRLGIPKKFLAPYTLRHPYRVPEVGSVGFKRVCLRWSDLRRQDIRGSDLLGFGAEYDLETGELKDIGFSDADIVESLGRAQGRPFSFHQPALGR